MRRSLIALLGVLSAALVVYACVPDMEATLAAQSPSPTASPIPVTREPCPDPAVHCARGINVKGLNYDDDSLEKGLALGFDWIKIYDHPPAERLPAKVLFRVNLPVPGEDWAQWGEYRRIDAELYAGRIDAYEIGNEPNLVEEWGGPPDPAAYATLLEIAYREIKSADPDALIVSAGLAPLNGWGDPNYVDDLDYLRGMYEAGAAAHFDVLGIHPFGFAYEPEMPVDGKLCVWDRNRPVDLDREMGRRVVPRYCRRVEGLCFRRAELMREIMVAYGDGEKRVWATEFGWITRPPRCCLASADWSGRYWQAVSERQQAENILGAFDYAWDYWSWMDVMFLWNLDYSRYPDAVDEECPYCDAMGWYSILDPDGSPRLAYEWLLADQ